MLETIKDHKIFYAQFFQTEFILKKKKRLHKSGLSLSLGVSLPVGVAGIHQSALVSLVLVLFPEAVPDWEEVPAALLVELPHVRLLARVLGVGLVDQVHQEKPAITTTLGKYMQSIQNLVKTDQFYSKGVLTCN